MTYYIDIRKISRRKRKAKTWESDVLEKKNGTRRIEKMKDEKDADETAQKPSNEKKIEDVDKFFL